VDAALPIRALIGDARLMDAARDREGDQLLMPLAPSAALVDLSELVAIRIEAIGIDAEKVPTPPLAAQAPELSPLDTEMPLPPSTSGSTSRPEMSNGLSAFTKLCLRP